VRLKVTRQSITVQSDGGRGTLIVGTRRIDIPAGKEITYTCNE